MRKNAFNFTLFLFLAGLFGGLFWYGEKEGWFPKTERKQEPEKPTPESIAAAVGAVSYAVPPGASPASKDEVKPPAPPAPPPVVVQKNDEPRQLIALGGPGFYNRVMLTNHGAGIQQVILPKFEEADRLGQAVKVDGQLLPLHLIPGVNRPRGEKLEDYTPPPTMKPGPVDAELYAQIAEPSYTLFHYATPDDKHPDPLLGTMNWRVVAQEHPDDGPHRVVFETELLAPYFIKIRKTFTLAPKDYHVGLQLEFERLKGGQKGQAVFRYQIAGPRGLPIEGEWYTSTYRVALIGYQNEKGAAKRSYEDAATVAHMRGGEEVAGLRRGKNTLKYAAIATQYFTSVLAIDDTAQGEAKNPWDHVRATTELPFGTETNAALPYFDDITFRCVAEPLDLNVGEKVTHSYLIYNGPAKVRLLKLLQDDKAVSPALVDRYLDGLDLKTITDYRSPTALGRFADAIYWTDLVIVFTNLMHWLLGIIHYVLPNWGVSIIILTIIVRLCLFVPSRKQTQMNLRMMEIQKKLKPELDKLHEKYKDDFQTFNREKTRLMMQHGMNPFAAMGGCLLLFAQMPIMMGLYYCLQESIFFRLDHFLWIKNLAAPDMTVWWTESIPYISTPADIGSFYYLGPYLNILPLLAVGLMLYQQNKMMPPPTDEQMAAQQRMMKIMMIFMAVMFYKVAAGLALYFIISTSWGIVERQFIPKPKVKTDDSGPTGVPGPGGSANGPVEKPKARGLLGRLREAMQAKIEELQKRSEEQSSRQIRNDRTGRTEPIRNPDRPPPDRGDRKKKRRK